MEARGRFEHRGGAADVSRLAKPASGVQRKAVDADGLRTADVETTTHLLLSALIEAALLISTDPRPEAALARVEPEFLRLLESLHAE